ncbi:hypothetical protein [Peribacillus frigoritolerans]|uniref:hypothetical protein n=1 Tax=Peribacillus frigoritolerans TaxID=450367 RepID=UPI0023DB72E3|nr:hypothetical protein [Peribacillus frigoritolerans]MDF1997185.1 hypothetical protein [Peribacillus frigoritolerans]
MERKVRDSCGKSVAKGDPAGERRGGSPDRPRKASAWSGNHYLYPLSEIRSLSADCLPSLFPASGCRVLAASYSAGVSQISSIL